MKKLSTRPMLPRAALGANRRSRSGCMLQDCSETVRNEIGHERLHAGVCDLLRSHEHLDLAIGAATTAGESSCTVRSARDRVHQWGLGDGRAQAHAAPTDKSAVFRLTALVGGKRLSWS